MPPFLVPKCLMENIRTGYKATKMASGDLLLELGDHLQYQRLQNLAAVSNEPITITPYKTLNNVKGVVSKVHLIYLSCEGLLTGWKEGNVIQVQRITIR